MAVVSSSYFLREPKQENSSVFHNHIDARSQVVLESIVKKIEEGSLDFQDKIYLVGYLHLGPQTKNPEFAPVYKQLPNFHMITNESDEAFSTGKMGDEGFNYDQVKRTLEVAFSFPGQSVMTELEEDIYGKEFDENGVLVSQMDRGNTPYTIDWTRLHGWKEKQIEQVPRFELHHGFDIAKSTDEIEPPIDLGKLSEETTKAGFQTGGWFIFRKKGLWSFRSNEFSNQDHAICVEKLEAQADRLRTIVASLLPGKSFTRSFSLEKVHAIWKV